MKAIIGGFALLAFALGLGILSLYLPLSGWWGYAYICLEVLLGTVGGLVAFYAIERKRE